MVLSIGCSVHIVGQAGLHLRLTFVQHHRQVARPTPPVGKRRRNTLESLTCRLLWTHNMDREGGTAQCQSYATVHRHLAITYHRTKAQISSRFIFFFKNCTREFTYFVHSPPAYTCIHLWVIFFPVKALFGCCRIHFNPYVLVWVEVEFSSSFTPIHLNTCGLMWIRLHPNKT